MDITPTGPPITDTLVIVSDIDCIVPEDGYYEALAEGRVGDYLEWQRLVSEQCQQHDGRGGLSVV
jgi:hypothetical protein